MKTILISTLISSAAAWGSSSQSTHTKTLTQHGMNPTTRYYKLGICKGDCDSDRDCDTGLKCHQRNSYEKVTGCEGSGVRTWDYCYLPSAERQMQHKTVLSSIGHSPNTAVHKLGHCQGDCDSNSDCATGLLCKQRNGFSGVTGCAGRGVRSWDYCYNPSAVVQQKSSKYLTQHGANPFTKVHKLGQCKGDCDSNSDCAKGLKCHQRNSYEKVTGCEGRGVRTWDYCYAPAPPTASPTRKPTARPTADPTRKPTQKPTNPPTDPAHVDTEKLTTHGYSAHTLSNVVKHGFGMCQGDCDSDAQCRGSMVCYHSHKSGNTITGCEGKTLDIHDYCYQPLKRSSPARCQEWSCAEWCKFFDQAAEDAGVYAKNGCADDGADTCQCM